MGVGGCVSGCVWVCVGGCACVCVCVGVCGWVCGAGGPGPRTKGSHSMSEGAAAERGRKKGHVGRRWVVLINYIEGWNIPDSAANMIFRTPPTRNAQKWAPLGRPYLAADSGLGGVAKFDGRIIEAKTPCGQHRTNLRPT